MAFHRSDPRQRATVHALLARARRTAEPSDRWRWLMAAHVAGQSDLRSHVQVHGRMLVHAWRTGDAREACGQVLRLLLVPLGHATGRLPVGNHGRATAGAFERMSPDADLRARIAAARREAAAPQPARSLL